MFQNINRGDGGRIERKEQPTHFFRWYIGENSLDETEGPKWIKVSEQLLTNKELAITEAQNSLQETIKDKKNVARIYAEVDEIRNLGDEENQESRTIWKADVNNLTGDDLDSEWMKDGIVY